MGKISDNLESIKRNYTESTLAHAEQNLGDAPGIVPPAFKLHIQQNAFKAGQHGGTVAKDSFQLKDKGEAKENSGASFVQNFQSKFNTNLSDVKVQKNSKEADKLGTKAFAKGNQIHFASGAYKPDTKDGQKVLGHELVHVLQQRKGIASPTGSINGQQVNEDKNLESQAHAQSDRASSGSAVSSSLKGTKAGASQAPVAQGWGFLKKIGKGIGKAVKSVGKVVGSVAKAGLGLAKPVASKIGAGISKALPFIGGALSKVGKGLSNGLKKGGSLIKSVGGKIWKGIKKGGGFLKSGAGYIGKGLRGMRVKGRRMWKRGIGRMRNLYGRGKRFARKGLRGLRIKGRRMWKRGMGRMRNLYGRGTRFVRKGLRGLRIKGRRMWKRGMGRMRNLFVRGKRAFGRGVRRFGRTVRRGFSKAKGMARGLGGFVKKAYNSGKSKLKKLLKKGLSAGSALAQVVMDNIKGGVVKVFKGLKNMASDPVGAVMKMMTSIQGSASKLLKLGKGVGKRIINSVKKIGSVLAKRGSGFLKGLKEVGGGIFGSISSIVGGLGGGFRKILQGNFKDGGIQMLMGVVNGALGAVDVVLDATVGMLDFTFGTAGEGKEVKGSDIPSQHIMDEFCAHGVSYKDFSALKAGTALNDKEKEVLRKGGYDPDNMIPSQGTHGFQAVLIMPLIKGKKPMLALRGTADMEGAITDADPQQVGHHQFRENAGKILALIQQGGGQVDVTGHSLGGAVAQITAAHFTKHIGRVTTFQSPGINKATVKLFTENMKKMKKGDRPEVNHHTVKNDLVSKAGQENLPGVVYEHDMGEINPLEAHTAWTSGTADRKADRAAYGMTDEFFNNQLGKEIYDESTIMKFKSNPHVFKRALAEAVRSLVGTARDGAVGLFSLGKKGVSKAWNFMKKIPGGLKKASSGAQHLVMKFLRFSKSKKKQLFKTMSNVMKKMSGGMRSLIGNLR